MAFYALIAGLVAMVFGLVLRSRLWRKGRSDPAYPNLFRLALALTRMPRRYLIDVHHVVARKPGVARMHVLAAGGLVASICLIVAVNWLSVTVTQMLLAAALCVAAAGALLAWLRRLRNGRHLSGGSYRAVPLLLGGFLAFNLVVLFREATAAPHLLHSDAAGMMILIFGLCASVLLFAGLTRGPLRHALVGALHLAFHPRPERFTRRLPAGPAPDFDLDGPGLGADQGADFRWTQLLSFDACVQCGRCEAVCPAYAAGQPLNPKALIVGLASAAGAPETYAGNGHPDGPALLPDAIAAEETLWSCTTCGACTDACPMLIEHVDAIIDMRRHRSLAQGTTPDPIVRACENARIAGSLSAGTPDARFQWLIGSGVRVIGPGQTADLVLWLGEGAYDARHRSVIVALVRLLKIAGIDFGILGAEERDCGDLACRTGDEYTFGLLARHNIDALGKRQFARIVSTDPHVVHTLRHEYRRFGADLDCIHHTSFLAELLEKGLLRPASLGEGAVTYHDPCYLARYNGETDAPRTILRHIGVPFREMERSGRAAMCCGGGGGAALADIPGKTRIADLRAAQAAATGAGTLAIACPNCSAMFAGVADAPPKTKDIAELLLEAVEQAETIA